jgi:signal transduction histidine kinase
VLVRRLSLKLLAPTVLVSLMLVAACTFGAFYLNALHVKVSDVLSENVQSTGAASRLETTTRNLLNLLRSQPPPRDLPEQVQRLNRKAGKVLVAIKVLANLPGEKELVPKIKQGMEHYLSAWESRTSSGTPAGDYRREAAILEKEVLVPCNELRKYNTAEIEKSDEENQAIVTTLRWGLLAVGLGGPLFGLLLGYGVARGLSHSIYQLSVRIRDAAGRLNRELGSVTLEEKGDLPDLHRRMQGVIEEIERVVEQLQQREREVLRAEQLAAVGQVAAGVAHELRNPLTSVKMLVQTGLEGDAPTGLPPEDLAVIEHEVRRMEQCIQMFIDFARPPQAERRRADLGALVGRALALVEGRARRQKVALVPELPGEPVVLEIDPEQVHQVVVNLLLNALDSLPRGGTVRVALARVPPPVNGRAPAGGVEVRVQDTGGGIPHRIQDRLFEPFVSTKETGLGLGLNISKRLIEAHGGTIRGENVPEGGAVFAFTLPL